LALNRAAAPGLRIIAVGTTLASSRRSHAGAPALGIIAVDTPLASSRAAAPELGIIAAEKQKPLATRVSKGFLGGA